MSEKDNSGFKLNGVTPMLETRELKESIDYYTTILGFTLNGVYPEDGKPFWASLSHGRTDLMLAGRNAHSSSADTVFTGTLYFYPDDVDAAWDEYKSKTDVEYDIEDFEYGMREFGIRDCNGYLLQFGEDLEAVKKRRIKKN